MAAAFGAENFGLNHSQTPVLPGFDCSGKRVVKAGLAGVGFKLGFGGEERTTAGPAAVHSLILGEDVLSRERRFGSALAQNRVLFRRQFLLPLLLGFCRILFWHLMTTGQLFFEKLLNFFNLRIDHDLAVRGMGILGKVILVVLLGWVEIFKGENLGGNRLL